MLDDRNAIIKKFKSAVTDSGSEVRRAPDKEGVSNLMTIYSAFTQKTDEEIEREFSGRGYGDFKTAVGETVADALAPVKARFDALMADRAYLESCYTDGAKRALAISQRTVDKVYKKLGLTIK